VDEDIVPSLRKLGGYNLAVISVFITKKLNLDYQGVGRRLLVVDPLTQGALPVYERDIDVSAVVVSSNGSAPESRVQGDRVTVPTFELLSNPTVRIAEARMRRFNVINRMQQKARQEIN